MMRPKLWHRWYIRFPGGFYALGPMLCPYLMNERQARAHARRVWNLTRLPVGTELWPA